MLPEKGRALLVSSLETACTVETTPIACSTSTHIVFQARTKRTEVGVAKLARAQRRGGTARLGSIHGLGEGNPVPTPIPSYNYI